VDKDGQERFARWLLVFGFVLVAIALIAYAKSPFLLIVNAVTLIVIFVSIVYWRGRRN
jgi:lipopolysaccharide export LptBFGC system permease protein LptF